MFHKNNTTWPLKGPDQPQFIARLCCCSHKGNLRLSSKTEEQVGKNRMLDEEEESLSK